MCTVLHILVQDYENDRLLVAFRHLARHIPSICSSVYGTDATYLRGIRFLILWRNVRDQLLLKALTSVLISSIYRAVCRTDYKLLLG